MGTYTFFDISHSSSGVRYVKRFFFLLVILASFSCNELLPPREDPKNVLAPSIHAGYSLTALSNGVGVTAKFVNIFDETLQGHLSIGGRFDLTWMRFPDVKKIGMLSSSNLAFARNYNGITGELTIDPGDSVTVTYFWWIMADSEAVLRDQIFQLVRDMSCQNGFARSVAEPETFIVTGEVRVFRNTAPIQMGQTEVSFCLVTAYVDPIHGCAPLRTAPPCGPAR